jgi:outer membrane protein assembly factor BamB
MIRNFSLLSLCAIAVGPIFSQDWPMWGGTAQRNTISTMKSIPESWDVRSGNNIKWKARIGSVSNGNPIVVDGKVYLGGRDGEVAVLKAGRELTKISAIDRANSVSRTLGPANGVLYIMTRSVLHAIAGSAG